MRSRSENSAQRGTARAAIWLRDDRALIQPCVVEQAREERADVVRRIEVAVDADGTTAGEYQVKKTFALGGVVGALTTTEDVEKGFAKAVAEIVKKKAAA